MITRRDFGRTAAAALAAARIGAAKPKMIDSRFHGVWIGAQTYSFRDMPLDGCIAAMKEIGLGEAELYNGHIQPKDAAELDKWRTDPPLDQMREVRRKFDDAGIVLYALNYSFGDGWTDQQIDSGFAIAKAMAVNTITSSSSHATAKRVAPFADKHRITVAFHNHSNMAPDQFARPADFEEAIALSPFVAINLDIGHFVAAGFDPVSFLEQHHDKIVTLHIKDRKKNQGPGTPFGEGDTPIKAVLQILKTKRYPIPANIEYEYAGTDTITEVKKCFAYCKAALK